MSHLRFCPKCGTKIATDERFCGNCGFDSQVVPDLEKTIYRDTQSELGGGGSANQQFAEPEAILKSASPNKEKKSSQMPLVIILIVVGSLILIGGTAFWWFSQGQYLFGKAGVSVGSQTDKIVLDLPSYSLNEGTYTAEQQVAINKPAGEGVQVFYTMDGSDPTITSVKYENPILLQTNTTLKSMAIDKDGNQSGIKTATYNIAITQPANPQPQTTTPAASTNADERAMFESNISGTWMVRESSGFVLYYDFRDGCLLVTDGGSDYFYEVYSFNVVPGTNGTIGTVYAGTHSVAIDCNPLGDNAIYIDGNYASYYQ